MPALFAALMLVSAKFLFRHLLLCIGLSMPMLSAYAADSGVDRLVELTRAHERELQVARFMLWASPFAKPAGATDCLARTLPKPMRALFARLYAAHLSETEAAQAIEFFSSEQGQEIVELRRAHEQRIFDAASQRRPVLQEQLIYPAHLQSRINAFESSEAGRKFFAEDLERAPPFKDKVQSLRAELVVACLTP